MHVMMRFSDFSIHNKVSCSNINHTNVIFCDFNITLITLFYLITATAACEGVKKVEIKECTFSSRSLIVNEKKATTECTL